MQAEKVPAGQHVDLRVGEIVEVRSEADILATLDARGELESLPFMPEMLQFCGRRFRVDKLAVKLCDTIGSTGMYRMRNAVHLEGVRCDGQAHGGCQAGCLVYWKEAWLKRVAEAGEEWLNPASDRGPDPAAPVWGGRRCWRRPARSAAPRKTSGSPARPRSCSGRRQTASLPGTSASTCGTCGRATPA